MCCIYLARNTINGKGYVGQTIDLEQRMALHKNSAEDGNPFIFHCAIRKYGWEAFEWSILYQDDDNGRERSNWWEQKFIRKLKTKMPNGYNMTDGGGWRGTGWKHSDEAKEKNRRAHVGIKHSTETKAKRAKSLTGRFISEETRAKISESVKRSYTNEHKQRTAECNKTRLVSIETRQKQSLAHLGKPSPKKGKQMSDKQKAKISESVKKFYNSRRASNEENGTKT